MTKKINQGAGRTLGSQTFWTRALTVLVVSAMPLGCTPSPQTPTPPGDSTATNDSIATSVQTSSAQTIPLDNPDTLPQTANAVLPPDSPNLTIDQQAQARVVNDSLSTISSIDLSSSAMQDAMDGPGSFGITAFGVMQVASPSPSASASASPSASTSASPVPSASGSTASASPSPVVSPSAVPSASASPSPAPSASASPAPSSSTPPNANNPPSVRRTQVNRDNKTGVTVTRTWNTDGSYTLVRTDAGGVVVYTYTLSARSLVATPAALDILGNPWPAGATKFYTRTATSSGSNGISSNQVIVNAHDASGKELERDLTENNTRAKDNKTQTLMRVETNFSPWVRTRFDHAMNVQELIKPTFNGGTYAMSGTFSVTTGDWTKAATLTEVDGTVQTLAIVDHWRGAVDKTITQGKRITDLHYNANRAGKGSIKSTDGVLFAKLVWNTHGKGTMVFFDPNGKRLGSKQINM